MLRQVSVGVAGTRGDEPDGERLGLSAFRLAQGMKTVDGVQLSL